MSKFKPGDMARTIVVQGYPTWSDRIVCIAMEVPLGDIPLWVQKQHPRAKEYYEIEFVDGRGLPSRSESSREVRGESDGGDDDPTERFICPDNYLIPLDPPKGEEIPPAVRAIFKPKPEPVKA